MSHHVLDEGSLHGIDDDQNQVASDIAPIGVRAAETMTIGSFMLDTP